MRTGQKYSKVSVVDRVCLYAIFFLPYRISKLFIYFLLNGIHDFVFRVCFVVIAADLKASFLSGCNNTSAKVVISNLPGNARIEDLEQLLAPYGQPQNYEKLGTKEGPTQAVQISFDTPEQAQQVITELNNTEFEGNKLRVETPMERRNNRGPGGPRNTRNAAGFGPPSRTTDFPLRILVPSEMVGAIIGRQGSTIRQITQQSRARVDVHRKENIGSVEKSITIYGNPENCTQACKKILEVMQQEAANTTKTPEITLKILAHNNLIGRIIGKGGNTIKRIMQETDTKIAVSSESVCSINEISTFNLERIITVKGAIENMSKAEALISAKLRQSYENDLQAMVVSKPSAMMFPGLPPMAMMATPGVGFVPRGGPPNYQPPLYSAGPAPYPRICQFEPPPPAYGVSQQDSQVREMDDNALENVYLYIPNNAVGAIIGTKGSQIRNMIRFSNASIKIASPEGDKADSNERKVTIVGTPEAQWKAQYMIFEKMREEGFSNGLEDVRLTVEIMVPSSQVGRIIGRGGQNVRELQRLTGSNIKLPDISSNAPSSGNEEETTVHIIGTFIAVQSAQRRIRSMTTPIGRPPRARGPPPEQQQ
ncbi:insulin-like growth factor 2 mRNA-binding protein 1 isoform X3 [Planococcus citri]|uniref:insulin-like growth factor 2 mRNA-binding protein 1 isoform X3 n=1 Tax=Planococcus citri TaxID=170843 RepID=UPI0031F9F6CE